MNFKRIKIQTKILLPLILLSILAGVSIYFYFANQYRATEEEALVEKARAVLLSAESAREFSAAQFNHKVFRTDLTNLQEVLYTVPIFSAMEVARKKSRELGYVLKVPKVSPRNPENQPDDFELRVLKMFDDKSKAEHTEFDKQNNQLRIFRPVVLTEECMACHGDPANSQKYWGRADGKDITGTKMEGWKVGEVHGAFELKINLTKVDQAVAAQSTIIAGIAGGFTILIIIFGLVLSRNINKEILGINNEISNLTSDVLNGKLDTRINVNELGTDFIELGTNSNKLIESFVLPIKLTSDYLKKVNEKEIPSLITDDYKGDFNEIKTNLNQLINTLNNFSSDMNNMYRQHELGDIDVFIKDDKYIGYWQESAANINKLVLSHITAKKTVMGVFTEFSNGNFDADIPLYPGKKAFMNNTINDIRKNLKDFEVEIKSLIDNVTKGNLKFRANYEQFNGGWKSLAEGVNQIVNQIVIPFNESSLVMQSLAEGDLTVRMRGKYFGDFDTIKQNINQLAESLENVITQFSESVNTTASSAIEIATTAESMASATQEISSQTVEVATSMEEMSSTVLDNSQSAKSTAEIATKNGLIAEEGGKVVGDTINKMRDIASSVLDTSDKLSKLAESTKQINEIVSVINDIADQTNMLALNAAIEAARAGQQGRGFAVVADEVRKLAERTTNATKQIAVMINDIQADTESALQVMEIGTKEVNMGINLADRASHSLEEIVSSTKEVTEMINIIADASNEQSNTSQQISQNISTISEVLNEAANGVTEVATTAEDLTKITVTLREIVSNFKISNDTGDQMITEYHGKSVNSFRNRALNGR